MGLMLKGAIELGIPMVIGSCGGSGGTPHLEREIEIIKEISNNKTDADMKIMLEETLVDTNKSLSEIQADEFQNKELIRLSEVIKKCDQYFKQILVHTGQNYDYTLNQIFFEDLQLREPDYYLDAVGAYLGETMGNIIAKSYKLMAPSLFIPE